MTKLHKDIAMHMMECVQSQEYSDGAAIKVWFLLISKAYAIQFHVQACLIHMQEVSIKTKELINNVKGLAPEGSKISLELLHKRKMNPATETFLFSLASAEGLTEL